ncbi:hypothetical protein HK104_007535, partial [Borealophlyctis nickersoniae]
RSSPMHPIRRRVRTIAPQPRDAPGRRDKKAKVEEEEAMPKDEAYEYLPGAPPRKKKRTSNFNEEEVKEGGEEDEEDEDY